MIDFLDNRTQRVILNGQYSSWAKVEAGVPQGSIFRPLLFLIYINNLSENLIFNPDQNFDPDPTEQAQELVFSRKVKTANSPLLFFNENVVPQTTLQKHLGMFLDSKLNFSKYFKTIFEKTNKTIGLLRKLETLFPRAPLITIYKLLIRSHLDYGDMIFDQIFNKSFQ